MILEFCQWLEHTSLGVAIGESLWLFPILESLNVKAQAVVVGSIAMMDLRLLGALARDRAVTELAAETLPLTWGAFAAAAITGFLLFASNASYYYDNTPFRVKIVLLGLAGANMLYFHRATWRTVSTWDRAAQLPIAARLAGAVSLGTWILVVIFGRWIGFV